MYYDDYDNLYKTEEEAREAARDEMEMEDYSSNLMEYISYEDLLRYLMHNVPKFWDDFAEEIAGAESRYFQDHYYEFDEDEDAD